MNVIDELRELSREWKIQADSQRSGWYGDEQSIDRFTEELDEVIQRASDSDASTWTCGCGTVNGVNLATCRVCGRKEAG